MIQKLITSRKKMSEKEYPWSEDETDTGTTTEANEPIEVDDDVSHEASENKEQGKFQSRWASFTVLVQMF
jgi:hypothetical protein